MDVKDIIFIILVHTNKELNFVYDNSVLIHDRIEKLKTEFSDMSSKMPFTTMSYLYLIDNNLYGDWELPKKQEEFGGPHNKLKGSIYSEKAFKDIKDVVGDISDANLAKYINSTSDEKYAEIHELLGKYASDRETIIRTAVLCYINDNLEEYEDDEAVRDFVESISPIDKYISLATSFGNDISEETEDVFLDYIENEEPIESDKDPEHMDKEKIRKFAHNLLNKKSKELSPREKSVLMSAMHAGELSHGYIKYFELKEKGISNELNEMIRIIRQTKEKEIAEYLENNSKQSEELLKLLPNAELKDKLYVVEKFYEYDIIKNLGEFSQPMIIFMIKLSLTGNKDTLFSYFVNNDLVDVARSILAYTGYESDDGSIGVSNDTIDAAIKIFYKFYKESLHETGIREASAAFQNIIWSSIQQGKFKNIESYIDSIDKYDDLISHFSEKFDNIDVERVFIGFSKAKGHKIVINDMYEAYTIDPIFGDFMFVGFLDSVATGSFKFYSGLFSAIISDDEYPGMFVKFLKGASKKYSLKEIYKILKNDGVENTINRLINTFGASAKVAKEMK